MKKLSFLLFSIVVFTSSCKKFLDVNVTPNNPTVVTPATILPSTTVAMAFLNSNDLGRAASLLVQHTAGTANQPAAYDVYILDGSFDNQWNFEVYGQAISDLQILIDQNSVTNPAYSGIAKLQMAYIFSIATDMWGDVPYSQAGQGMKYPNPRFDKQEDIYMGNAALGITSLFDLVKSGIADLSKSSFLKPGGDDLVYKGALNSWIRAGNTLLLKFALQISNRNPTFAKTTIQSVIDGNNYINSNTLDLEVPFGSTVGNQNPIFVYNNLTRTSDQMLSNRLLNLERSLNDTIRLSKYFTKTRTVQGNPNTPLRFVGFDNGSTAAAPALATRSKYNAYLTGATDGGDTAAGNVTQGGKLIGQAGGAAPIRLLTNFQVQFILAESALILGTSGDPNAYYQAGIKANMLKIGMTQAEIDNYFLTNPTVVTLSGTTEQKRQQIITQKYIAWIGNGIEAYNDYRRTRYPPLTLALNAQGDNPNVIPERLPYTAGELAANPNAPNPRPKTDVKVWWAL